MRPFYARPRIRQHLLPGDGRHGPQIAGHSAAIRPAVLQSRSGASTGVPQGEDLYGLGGFSHSIIEVVVNATEMDTPHAGKLGIRGPGSDLRLSRDEFQRALDLLAKRAGSLRTIGVPPCRRFRDLVRRTADDPNGELASQSSSRNLLSNCSPVITSPRSASAMAASSDASASASSVERLIALRRQHGDGAAFFQRLALNHDPAGNHFACDDFHIPILANADAESKRPPVSPGGWHRRGLRLHPADCCLERDELGRISRYGV